MTCRLYIDDALIPGTSIELPADQAHYLRSVMRFTTGDPVILFNGSGGEYHAEVQSLSKGNATLAVTSFSEVNREMACRIHIVQAACRSEKIDSILQKGTELGAASFHIMRSERSSLKLDGAKLSKRMLRWQKIIIEAAEQSQRTIVPTIAWHEKLSSTPACGLCYTLHPASETSWGHEKANMLAADEITLAIGPEGGWSDRDIEILKAGSFTNLTFGPRVMRTETAAPALLAAIGSLIES